MKFQTTDHFQNRADLTPPKHLSPLRKSFGFDHGALFKTVRNETWAGIVELAGKDSVLADLLSDLKTTLCTRDPARRDHLLRQIRAGDETLSKLSDRSASGLLARRGNRFSQSWHPLRPCSPADQLLAEILFVNSGKFPAESAIRRALADIGTQSREVRHAIGQHLGRKELQ